MGNKQSNKKIEEKKCDIIIDKYKIVFVGPSCSGAKTSLIKVLLGQKFCQDEEVTSTFSFVTKRINNINAQLWDSIGPKALRHLNKFVLKNADCIILGYDVTRRDSFEEIVDYWCSTAKNIKTCKLFYLIGNKIDLYLDREISAEEGEKFAEKENLRFFEVSCRTGEGIKKFLDDLENNIAK